MMVAKTIVFLALLGAPTEPEIADMQALPIGPLMDPIDGSRVTAAEREFLPSGRHIGSVVDLWFVNVSSLQTNGGGIARFDPLYVSSHGRSWTQTHFLLNGLDMTDPGQPGRPMVMVPFRAWDAVHTNSMWTAMPGVDFRLHSHSGYRARGTVGTGAGVGGGTWVPRGFMDREPAVPYGAPEERRSLDRPLEADLALSLPHAGGTTRAHIEYVDRQHQFPVTMPGVVEQAGSASVMLGHSMELGNAQFALWGLGEVMHRDHADGQFRLPQEYTHDARGEGFWLQGDLSYRHNKDLTYSLQIGGGSRWDRRYQNSDVPIVTDIEEEWLWLARPRFGGRQSRSKLSALGEVLWGSDKEHIRMSVQGSVASIHETFDIAQGRTGTTYMRNPVGDAGLTQTVYEPAKRAEYWLGRGRAEIEARHDLVGWDTRFVLGLDHGSVGTPGRTALSHTTPALGVAVRKPLSGGRWGEFYALVRREPEILNQQVAAFLDPNTPSGYRYRWDDDGNLVPEAGEEGELLARTGGRFHAVDPNLRRPTSNHFAFGWRTGRFGPFRASVSGLGRMLFNPYTVRADEHTESSYRETTFFDPGGDGRGEQRIPGGGQLLDAYARDPGTEGQETYILTNHGVPTLYAGAEIQLMTEDTKWWFLNLGAIGYWSIGDGQYGSFPDRNDSGIIAEHSADPNLRVNQRGRFDNDRAFGINLLAGLRPFDNFTSAVALKYRDGLPFSRTVVADDLPQGPTPIMATWRGAARLTFQMTVDLRFSYHIPLEPFDVTANLDVYNLLGSGTEIVEDSRTGREFRTALEMMPPRMVFFVLAFSMR